MSESVKVEPVEEQIHGGVGRCKFSFWFAVAHDILGVFIMLVGVFGGLAVHDLFVYAGGIIIFLSLIWWVFWYSGNIDVPPEELEDDVGMMKLRRRGLNKVVRRMSDRIATGIRSSFRKSGGSLRRGPAGSGTHSNAGTNLPLSTIYDTTIPAPSRERRNDTLSV